MSDERPAFGYGQGQRPLWSERDRDAERVRDILRGAGLVEFNDTPDPDSWWRGSGAHALPGGLRRSSPGRGVIVGDPQSCSKYLK
jgi:hypothetical protein